MTDFKSAAEQQVRETLGWWIEDGNIARVNGTRLAAYSTESNAYNLAISKTAELLEMTAQRDEAQKALAEIVKFCMMESTPIAADIRAIHSTAKRALRGRHER